MDDGRCIRLARKVVEGGQAATDVGNAEEPALGGVEYFCLRVDPVWGLGIRRARLASRGRRWAGEVLHSERQWRGGDGRRGATPCAFNKILLTSPNLEFSQNTTIPYLD